MGSAVLPNIRAAALEPYSVDVEDPFSSKPLATLINPGNHQS